VAWFNRPEGFITKSNDVYAPAVKVANGITFAARIGTITTEAPRVVRCRIHITDPHREGFCGACLDAWLAR
jgi:hypothetical protein